MTTTLRAVLAAGLILSFAHAAQAAPNCLRGHKAFELKGDHVAWNISSLSSAECLQGLRWSYMQIYTVNLITPPKFGKLEIMGSGFRYVADSSAPGADTFKLQVLGKNRRDVGASTIDITVSTTSRDPS